MITHSVAFRLKYELNQPQVTEFLDQAKQLSNIPGVLNFEIFKQIGRKTNFTHALSMKFESQQAYDRYNVHPDHLYFVEQVWKPQVVDFLELDYVAWS